jgi:TfoX/Sxy family transcriptional regulator of competence genes
VRDYSTNCTIRKSNSPIVQGKWAKDRHLLKEDTQTTNRYRKKCSTSFTIREIKVKSKMRYHLIPAMLTIIKKME